MEATGKLWMTTIIYDDAAESGGAAGEILSGGHHFDVDAKLMCAELCERNDRGVCHERNVVLVGNACQSGKVSHFKLRVGDNLKEDAACVLVYGSLHFFEVGKVAEMRSDTQTRQGLGEERIGIAEHVAR